MNAGQIAYAVGCVFLIAVGQLLFKAVGIAISAAGTIFHTKALVLGAIAGGVYLIATVAWIWLLRTVPLAIAYPYMALSFVLVPALSVLYFHERLSVQYMLGITIVISGLLVLALDSK